jgi:hypothetical protein
VQWALRRFEILLETPEYSLTVPVYLIQETNVHRPALLSYRENVMLKAILAITLAAAPWVMAQAPPDLPPPRTNSEVPPPKLPHVADPEQQPNTVTIPEGTVLSVRLGEPLSSRKNKAGDTFRATLSAPLVVDGFILADRGARAEGRVAESTDPRRVKGQAMLSLELVRVFTEDKQEVMLETDRFVKKGGSSKEDDAAKVVLGTALGAIVGAAAGGGKGAAIGAGAGAAAGGGAVAVSKSDPAVLKTEAELTFKTARPIIVTEKLDGAK